MNRLSEKQRIGILMMIGYGDKTRTQAEVCNLFNNKYPDRPITRSTVSKVEAKFRNSGNIGDNYKKGRPGVTEDQQLDVLLSLQENPHKPTRQVALEQTMCQSSALKCLKKNKWHPYKVQVIHELNEDDFDRRQEFCELMTDRCNNDPQFIRHCVFSDEATFCLNGTVNRQNCRYWAPENPHWAMEGHSQYPQKVNVWAGIVGNTIVGPFFIDGSLNGNKYLDLLQHHIIPAFAALYHHHQNPQLPDNSLWYQQDGATPHYARHVHEYLDNMFSNRWIYES